MRKILKVDYEQSFFTVFQQIAALFCDPIAGSSNNVLGIADRFAGWFGFNENEESVTTYLTSRFSHLEPLSQAPMSARATQAMKLSLFITDDTVTARLYQLERKYFERMNWRFRVGHNAFTSRKIYYGLTESMTVEEILSFPFKMESGLDVRSELPYLHKLVNESRIRPEDRLKLVIQNCSATSGWGFRFICYVYMVNQDVQPGDIIARLYWPGRGHGSITLPVLRQTNNSSWRLHSWAVLTDWKARANYPIMDMEEFSSDVSYP